MAASMVLLDDWFRPVAIAEDTQPPDCCHHGSNNDPCDQRLNQRESG